MRVDVLTLFPEMFSPLDHSIVKRARAAGHLDLQLHQLRDWAEGKHRMVDDVPYGGGPGMVLKPEPMFAAIRDIQNQATPRARVLLTSPQGTPMKHDVAERLAGYSRLLIVCGHYEGVDQRVVDALVDEELSLGDFVLTGGEIPALAIIDAVTRLLPGVIEADSLQHESFTGALLDFPHYTRPRDFEGMGVPPVLLSGHHGDIDKWRRQQALLRTFERRPEMLEMAALTEQERRWLERGED